MDKMCVSTCEPTEPKFTRIMAIYEQVKDLGNVIVGLQKVVNTRRVEYYAIDVKGCEEEGSKGGIVNDIEWMIDDIKSRVLDIREYVEAL